MNSHFASHVFNLSAVLAVLCSAAACGGGDADPASTHESPSITDSKSTALSVAASSWTPVATEWQSFAVSGTQTVRYGSGANWTTKTVTDAVAQCTNQYFGNDPLIGTVKQCEIAGPSGPPAATWVQVAAEGQAFGVSGTRAVRYGIDSNWVVRTVSGSGDCSNTFFGSDPAYGTVKRCEAEAASEVIWTQIANEGEGFTVSGTQTVRFGAASNWISRDVMGPGLCSNGYFGSDPLVGVFKRCETSLTAAPVPVPTPAPVPSPSLPPLEVAICTPPISLVDTSGVAPSVGDGTPGSCTESSLRGAIAGKSIVTFNCGPAPVTIPISSTISVPTGRDTVIDGNGLVTLDGGNGVRILSMVNPNYRSNNYGLTLQRMRFVNGKAPGTGYVAPDPSNAKCAYGYAGGAGGAIEVRDAKLYVINSEFQNNAAATPGPDIGGGAIFAAGSRNVIIVGSRFIGNTGANAGGAGFLQTDVGIYNSLFQSNTATGTGANYAGSEVASCPGVGHVGQGGAGGNGGAVTIDGSDNVDAMVCGSRFIDNKGNALGGAFFRTANTVPRRTVLDRSLFQNNRSDQAGAVYIQNASPLDITASTFVSNVARGVGAAQLVGSKLNIVNSTFSSNEATLGVGGALMLNYPDAASQMLNVTFANNKASGGAGSSFSAAIFGHLNFPVLNTVFSNNVTNDPWNPMQCTFTPGNGSGSFQWPMYRAVGGATDTPCVTDITFADPQLGPLTANGGPTLTIAPSSASPLRGVGRNCPLTDQRGVTRNQAQCTVGAVE